MTDSDLMAGLRLMGNPILKLIDNCAVCGSEYEVTDLFYKGFNQTYCDTCNKRTKDALRAKRHEQKKGNI